MIKFDILFWILLGIVRISVKKHAKKIIESSKMEPYSDDCGKVKTIEKVTKSQKKVSQPITANT